jgi:competence protein ComEC
LARLSRLDRVRLSFLRQRSHLLERLRDGADDLDAYAVVAAMTLGDKSALTRDVKDVYSVTGGSHVLALSGLHLGIIYTLLSLLVVGRRWHAVSQLLLVVGIWAFVLLVGMPVSVVRSAVMLTVYALLSLGHRGRMSVNVLAFTAVILLMFSPLSLFDVGFQMSFMAVFSILLWMPLADRVFSEAYLQRHRVVRWGWSMIAVSFAAQMGVAPLVAYYFGRFSTYFLLTNFIVLPAASLILYLTPVVLLVPSLAYLLLYIAGWLNRILAWVASLPGASIDHLHPSVIQVTMAYVVIAALWLLVQRVGRIRRAA